MHGRLQSLRLIAAALASGQLAFLAVVLLIQRSIVPPDSLDPTVLPVLAVLVLMAAVGSAMYVGRRLLARAAHHPDPASRWTAYQTAVIVRMACAEGASFFQIVCYLLTGEPLFLLIFAASFVAFWSLRPIEDEWDRVRSGSR